ncbi:MAG TPA: MFS transporter [Terracidiphilus sp.]|nr:MFS transporter [Terracidiphilus sp.]
MISEPATKSESLRALKWLNFFVADVQTGLGPLIAAYLASNGWSPARLGVFLTLGGLIPIALQIPAGGLVDGMRSKRGFAALAIVLVAAGALLLSRSAALPTVASAQVCLAVAGLFLAPILNAITLGITGPDGFDLQLGRNQSFAAAGNVAAALVAAGLSYKMGMRSVFLLSAVLSVPTLACLSRIRAADIDPGLASGAAPEDSEKRAGVFRVLLEDRVLLIFLVCAALFHLANAAMLPQLGEMLAHGQSRMAGPMMSTCVLVTQLVITFTAASTGRLAGRVGRRPLLLAGFGVLVIRGALYTVVHGNAALIAVQLLDGVANVIFGVVSALVVADRTRGTGRFNLVQGALATFVGIGAALSTTYGGLLIKRFGYNASFLGLAGVGLVAFLTLLVFFPETLETPPELRLNEGEAAA